LRNSTIIFGVSVIIEIQSKAFIWSNTFHSTIAIVLTTIILTVNFEFVRFYQIKMPSLTDIDVFQKDIFRRVDESRDERFYDFPRLVTHIDDQAISAVTELYRKFFPSGGAILDLMSSFVSHLPAEINYSRVAGLGMNFEELNANPRLTERIVQNLNEDTNLPYGDDEFDGAGICVSVQYLTEPIKVFREIARVLKVDAPLVVTFSNRCFPTKAVFAWNTLDDDGHIELVSEYFAGSKSFGSVEIRKHIPRNSDPLFAVIGRVKK
jgi:SAM-dependent methyltransferase